MAVPRRSGMGGSKILEKRLCPPNSLPRLLLPFSLECRGGFGYFVWSPEGPETSQLRNSIPTATIDMVFEPQVAQLYKKVPPLPPRLHLERDSVRQSQLLGAMMRCCFSCQSAHVLQ